MQEPTANQNQDNDQNQGHTECPLDTCEYFHNGYRWMLIRPSTLSGYICYPPEQQAPFGTFVCIPPLWDWNHRQPGEPEFLPGEHYVDYSYQDGKFQIIDANCPAGFQAPADPLELAKKYGRLRIYPVRFPEDGPDQGGPDQPEPPTDAMA